MGPFQNLLPVFGIEAWCGRIAHLERQRKWNFSPVIQEADQRHHTPLMNGDFSFAGAVIFLAHFVSASDPSGEILETLQVTKILTKLNLNADDFDNVKNIYKSGNQNNP